MEPNTDGAQLFAQALNETTLAQIESALSHVANGRPGVRIGNCGALRPMLAASGSVGRIAAEFLGEGCRPVRTILFDKSEQANWALGWHQDRTIAVASRVEVPGFGAWSRKAGIQHVEPPVELLERMVTLRVHLDPVDDANAPLLIAPGSHKQGRIAESQIDSIVESCGSRACLAQRGDIWAYATLVLHSSDRSRRLQRRRVLQVDYSAAELPGGLQFYSDREEKFAI